MRSLRKQSYREKVKRSNTEPSSPLLFRDRAKGVRATRELQRRQVRGSCLGNENGAVSRSWKYSAFDERQRERERKMTTEPARAKVRSDLAESSFRRMVEKEACRGGLRRQRHVSKKSVSFVENDEKRSRKMQLHWAKKSLLFQIKEALGHV